MWWEVTWRAAPNGSQTPGVMDLPGPPWQGPRQGDCSLGALVLGTQLHCASWAVLDVLMAPGPGLRLGFGLLLPSPPGAPWGPQSRFLPAQTILWFCEHLSVFRELPGMSWRRDQKSRHSIPKELSSSWIFLSSLMMFLSSLLYKLFSIFQLFFSDSD